MARVNVDIGVVRNDPRWLILCRDTGLPLWGVLGHALLAWGAAYERKLVMLPAEHIDLAADRTGFAHELCRAGLATETPDGIRMCGVEERIQYLLTQQDRGRRGGLAKAIADGKRPLGNGSGTNTNVAVACGVLWPTSGSVSGSSPDLAPAKKPTVPVFPLESVYQRYPRKEGKTRGLEKLRREIKTPDDFEALGKAVDNYAALVRRDGTEPRFVKHFSTFAGCWRDYLTLPAPRRRPEDDGFDIWTSRKEPA